MKMQRGRRRQAQKPNVDQNKTTASPTQATAVSDMARVAAFVFRAPSMCFRRV